MNYLIHSDLTHPVLLLQCVYQNLLLCEIYYRHSLYIYKEFKFITIFVHLGRKINVKQGYILSALLYCGAK